MKKSSATNSLESMSQAVWYNQWTLRKFNQYLTGNILEVGCGIGNFTKPLTKYGKVWAIDVNKEYVAQTKQKVNSKAQVGYGDIETGKYFFKDGKFDCIVCLNVLEHIKDDDRTAGNLFKLLKKGGKLILLVPAHQFLYGEIDRAIGHFRRYGKSDLAGKLVKLGFKIIKFRILNCLGALGWFLAGRILKEKRVAERNIKIFNALAPFVLPVEDVFEPAIGTSILMIAQKV